MKMSKFKKKNYRYGIVDSVFSGCISLILVLETNLISRTLKIPIEILYFIGVSVILFWNIAIIIKLKNINIVNTKGIVLLNNSKKIYEVVKKIYWAPSVIILSGMAVNDTNFKFVLFAVSIIAILFVKHCFFDNIIIFTNDGYNSGFDKMIIDSTVIIMELERLYSLLNEDFVTFEVYSNNKMIAFDKFYNSEYQYLCKMISST